MIHPMNPVAHIATPRPRATERCVTIACSTCGQAFALHFMSARAESTAPSDVPCINDACGCEVAVMLPAGAFALWIEEL